MKTVSASLYTAGANYDIDYSVERYRYEVVADESTAGLARGAFMIGIPRGDHQWCWDCEDECDCGFEPVTDKTTRWLTGTIGTNDPDLFLTMDLFISAVDNLIGTLREVSDGLYAAAQTQSGVEGPQRSDAIVAASANFHAARYKFYPWDFTD